MGILFGISAGGFGLGIMDEHDRDGGGLTRGLGRDHCRWGHRYGRARNDNRVG